MSRNVTVEMDEYVGRWARVEAARNGKRLSGWIAERLGAPGGGADASSNSARPSPATPAEMDAIQRFLNGPGYAGISADLPTRDEIHDRPALRRHQPADL